VKLKWEGGGLNGTFYHHGENASNVYLLQERYFKRTKHYK